jgi:hypothetical protein
MVIATFAIYISAGKVVLQWRRQLLKFAQNDISTDSAPNPPSTRYDKRPRKSIPSSAANRAAISYCKYAVLFFIAMLVTWVPSTLNRLIELAHPKEAIFGLNYASSMVLPLQGFWNAIIYIFTSLPAVKALVRRIMTALHIGQMPRWQFSTTDASSGSHGLGSKNQPADCSESVQELHPNTEDGPGIEMK